MEVTAKAKKWGNSLGIVIPKNVVEQLGLKEDEEVTADINSSGRSDVLKKAWGLCKGSKKTAQEWKDEFRRTLYKEY